MRVFDLRKAATTDEFVNFWSAHYKYPLEHLYESNIRQALNPESVWQLYRWKNGTEKIAQRKQQSILNVYIPQLNSLPKLDSVQKGRDYIDKLDGGAIWGIFWLHCVNDTLFPIFDQHTYRAMAHIEGIPTTEIPSNRAAKLVVYFDQYLPFLENRFKGISSRLVDKALFSYGQFLKSKFAR